MCATLVLFCSLACEIVQDTVRWERFEESKCEGGEETSSSEEATYHFLVPFIIREQPFNVQGVFLWKPQLMVTGQGNLFLCHSLDLSVSSQRSNIIGYWKEEKPLMSNADAG